MDLVSGFILYLFASIMLEIEYIESVDLYFSGLPNLRKSRILLNLIQCESWLFQNGAQTIPNNSISTR